MSVSTSRVSQVGAYEGYTVARYDGWVRASQYVSVRDGTKLAVDVYRPTAGGVVEEVPQPVVWTAKRYLRATIDEEGKMATLIETPGQWDRPAARKLIAHGYVLAAADMRGTGASFGTWSECSDPAASTDGYDVNEWLAAQPWCNGITGMFGVSYEGRMQLNVASAAPPGLRAIMPEVSPFEWYSIIHEGGIYGTNFAGIEQLFRACDADPATVAAEAGQAGENDEEGMVLRVVAPVDDDPRGLDRAAAWRQHAGNDYSATSGKLPFRDSVNARGRTPWLENDGVHLVRGIERSGVATYHTSGWFARVGLDQLMWFGNLARGATGDRHRILMGPWQAGGQANADDAARELWAVETLRFMDYWLRGIDNGIMREPPIVYSTSVAATDRPADRWRYANEWPLPEAEPVDFFFQGGRSGSVSSLNDGVLVRGAVAAEAVGGEDVFVVDYSLAAPMGEREPGVDYRSYDERCLTYTTEALEQDVEVTGHPVVHLFVSSSADDCDFAVTLEDVDQLGVSTLVTDRRMRASHRALAEAPYYYFDLPWHSNLESDREPIPPEQVVELAFDVLVTSYRFRAGHRIRVTVAGADQAHLSPVRDPAPWVSVHRGADHPSRITLPAVGTHS